MDHSQPKPLRELGDGESGSGSVNQVFRDGDLIRRPAGQWTSAVHDLLRYLEKVEFGGAPRVAGMADAGTEFLSYIPGAVAMRPWPGCLLADSGMTMLGTFLRRYHQAVAGYEPSADAKWRVADARWRQGQIVRHGDLGPWNIVWRDGNPVGIIDWDFAEPGYPVEDVAQLAWHAVPLVPPQKCRETGIEQGRIQFKRLGILCESYGVEVSQVVDTVLELQHREVRRIVKFGRAGQPPWDFFLKRGDVEEIGKEIEWLVANRA